MILPDVSPTTDPEQFNTLLATISQQMNFPPNLRLAYLPLDQMREQDINANSMPKKMFDQLVENIKNAGAPESLPLCATIEGAGATTWIISGHHRIRASRTAGMTHILTLFYENLSWSKARAKQLAHNSIAGSSDPELVKRIWDEIDDVQARFEAFIDPRMFDEIPAQVSFQPVDVLFEDKTILIIWLSSQHQDMEAAMEAVMPKGQVDSVYLAHKDSYNAAMTALKRIRAELDVKAVPTAMAEIFRLAIERLDQLQEESDVK